MQNAEVFKWDDLPMDSPMPLLERQRIIGNKMMISNVVLKKGCFVNSHSHENEQFALVVSGEVRFGLGKEGSDNYRELVLKSGEVLYLPSFVEHSAF
ncbi:cupin domain-containing protein, partial [bacterium]|nr:cupin domain-containing protein [bacterium]